MIDSHYELGALFSLLYLGLGRSSVTYVDAETFMRFLWRGISGTHNPKSDLPVADLRSLGIPFDDLFRESRWDHEGQDQYDGRPSLHSLCCSAAQGKSGNLDDSIMGPRPEKDFALAEEADGYTVPNNQQGIDEIAAPPPVKEHDERLDTLDTWYPRHGRQVASTRDTHCGQPQRSHYSRYENSIHQRLGPEQGAGAEGKYSIPEAYGALEEVAAPSPTKSRQSDQDGALENRLSSSRGSRLRRSHTSKETFEEDEEHNLTELTGPAPVEQNSSRDVRNVPARPFGSENEQKRQSPRQARISKFATELYTVSYLILFSLLGTLARLGLQALTSYPGAPVQTGVLWCNFAGSLIMGFLSEDRKLFCEDFETSEAKKAAKYEHDAEKAEENITNAELQSFISAAQKQATTEAQASVKKTIPLYIGLATGFCGSFTSFSSFIRDSFLALSNALPVPVPHISTTISSIPSNVHRNGGYSFLAICAVIILTLFLCIGALLAGAHLALTLEPITPRIPSLSARLFIDRTATFLAWAAWLAAIVMAIWPPERPGGPVGTSTWTDEFWRGDALFALVFAPVGCLLRFYVSLHLNGKIQSFPLGTFAVNIFGTAVESMLYTMQHVPMGGRVDCQVLQGLMDGFCGCLTTVSTWVAELKGLRLRHAYIYGAVSVATGVSLMVVIMGPVQWSRGFRPPLCLHH